MTETTLPARPARRLGARVWAGVVAAWGVVAGLAPHGLHHAGPLAGAALLAGFGGKALFFALGLVLSVPLLLRLYRRFHNLAAPFIAIVVFAAMFTVSSLVIAPRITGTSDREAPAKPGVQQSSDHASHHNSSK